MLETASLGTSATGLAVSCSHPTPLACNERVSHVVLVVMAVFGVTGRRPPAAEYDRLKAKRKLENCWFVLRNSSVEMAENVMKLDDWARDLLAWLDVHQPASKDELEAKRAETQNGLNEFFKRQVAVAGKKRKLEDP